MVIINQAYRIEAKINYHNYKYIIIFNIILIIILNMVVNIFNIVIISTNLFNIMIVNNIRLLDNCIKINSKILCNYCIVISILYDFYSGLWVIIIIYYIKLILFYIIIMIIYCYKNVILSINYYNVIIMYEQYLGWVNYSISMLYFRFIIIIYLLIRLNIDIICNYKFISINIKIKKDGCK